MLFFILIMDLYFLIPVEITQVLNYTVELVIPIGIPTNEANAEEMKAEKKWK